MKILMLFPYAPLPPPLDLAGTKRNLPFFLELARRHEVSVLSFGTPEEEALFRKSYGDFCREVRFVDRRRPRCISAFQLLWLFLRGRSSFQMLYRPSMQRAIDDMTAACRYDLIHCCVQFFGYFSFPDGIPVTSDTHEVKYDLLRRTAQNTRNLFQKAYLALSAWLGKPEEIKLCKKFDLLIATTDRDLQVFKKHLPDRNIVAISNGAGESFFEDLGIAPEPFTMVFTGLFTHLPNSDGMAWFLDKVFPLILAAAPEARICVVGKSPPRHILAKASRNVVVTGFVEDVRPYIARAQVFVIPLLAGGGIRGKALEAMAMRRPIVTTTIGVEGIHLHDGESALFADTAEEFAQAVIRIFGDPELRGRIAGNAFAVVQKHYNWQAKGKELDRALCSVAEARVQSISRDALPGAVSNAGSHPFNSVT